MYELQQNLLWLIWMTSCTSSQFVSERSSPVPRVHFANAPSQWETSWQCNVVSHWLSAWTEGSVVLLGLSWRFVTTEFARYFALFRWAYLHASFDCAINFISFMISANHFTLCMISNLPLQVCGSIRDYGPRSQFYSDGTPVSTQLIYTDMIKSWVWGHIEPTITASHYLPSVQRNHPWLMT